MRTCPNCGEENGDRARFCQACGTALDAAEAAPREVRKVVTVLFADVTGSTSLGERLDPESLRKVMERFFDTMKTAIEAHGGVVEKFIGDAVMAVFGIPRLHEDDPLRAVRAAAAMAQALAALNTDLQAERGVTIATRTGITTGEVVAGDPSAGQRLVTGDTVNTAARLEQAAQPGETLIGEPTYRLVRDAVDVEPVEPLSVKGKAEALPAYRLVGVQAGVEAHIRRLDSPMVGRDRELRLLGEALDRAVSERTCHLFTLLGPAGVGKSRLVLEFLSGLADRATVVRGRCLSYGEGITFYPVAEAVRDAAGVADTDSAEEARRKVEQAAADTDQPAVVTAGVTELVGLAEARVAAEDAFWAVRSLFESQARDRPLVVVFDDIHWAEPAFLDLVEHIADWTRDAPILLLCVARPELLDLCPGWAGGKLNATSILLEPLGSDHGAQLLDNLLGAGGLPPEARSRILEAAEGNPLFVEEMIGMLVDDGLLRQEDGRWTASEEVARVAVPPTIQLLLAARLDRLDAAERAVAERASVEGKIFHRGAVTSLSPDGERPQVRTRLLALARKELIRPDRAEFAGEDAFRFRHLLIRDAAYQGMPKQARAELHLRFADWLAEQAGDRLGEYEDIIGYHLEQAYRYRTELGLDDEETAGLAERAATVLASAGRRARARDDDRAASRLLGRSIDLLPPGGAESREIRLELAEALASMGEFSRAHGLFDQVEAEARAAGDRRHEAIAIARHPFLAGTLDPSETTRDALDAAVAALRTLQELGDRKGALLVGRTVAFLKFVRGDVDDALRLNRSLLPEARALGNMPELRRLVAALGGGLYYGSTPVAEAIAEVLAVLPELTESRFATAEIKQSLPAMYAMQGRHEDARRVAAEVRATFEALGAQLQVADLVFWTVPMYRLAGDLAAAERDGREAIPVFEGIGDKGFLSTIVCELAETLLQGGDVDEAERFAAYGRSLGAEDDIVTQLEWRAALAGVASARGDHVEAERLAREAVAIGAPTDYLDMRADSWLRLGEVLRAAGREDEATQAMEQALELYVRKGNVVMAGKVRGQLLGEPGPTH